VVVLLSCLAIVVVALAVLGVLTLRLLRRTGGAVRDIGTVQREADRLQQTLARAQTLAEQAQDGLSRRSGRHQA
jgi:hypothetical protein